MSYYVKPVVDKYALLGSLDITERTRVFDPICRIIDGWSARSGYCLLSNQLSGSRAKATAISLCSDMDIFISLSSTTNGSLESIYNSLFDYIRSQGIQCKKQNVSIGIVYNSKNVDLVPGRRQHQWGDDHSLWKNKQNTWTQTNVTTHISTVRKSNRAVEIMATKIWRERHGLEFPSLFLELAVIEALKYHVHGDYDDNFWSVLGWLCLNIADIRIVDPSNSGNIISDDLTQADKKAIADKALESRRKQNWSDVIW